MGLRETSSVTVSSPILWLIWWFTIMFAPKSKMRRESSSGAGHFDSVWSHAVCYVNFEPLDVNRVQAKAAD